VVQSLVTARVLRANVPAWTAANPMSRRWPMAQRRLLANAAETPKLVAVSLANALAHYVRRNTQRRWPVRIRQLASVVATQLNADVPLASVLASHAQRPIPKRSPALIRQLENVVGMTRTALVSPKSVLAAAAPSNPQSTHRHSNIGPLPLGLSFRLGVTSFK